MEINPKLWQLWVLI